jgi:nitric oxide reductase NorD protein
MTARPDFEPGQHALTLYYRALSGHGCEIVAYDDDTDLFQRPDTATTIRLPAHAPIGPDWSGGWYQVAVTHRALHHQLGTFALDLDGPEPLFDRRRRRAKPGIPHLEQFARWFSRTALAVEIFVILEDLRVDSAADRLLRSAVAEALVRLSLGAEHVDGPPALAEPLRRVAGIASRLFDPRATVESSAEATIRVYDVLAELPNVGAHRTVRRLSFAELAAGVDVDDPAYGRFRPELRLEGDEKFDVRPAPVHYRDAPGPRYAGQQSSGMPLQEAILRMTPDDEAAENPDEDGFAAKSLAAERGGVDVTAPDRPDTPPEPLPHDHGPDLDDHHDAVSGHLHARGRDEFTYPEWDWRAGRYLRDWCLLRLRRPKPVRSDRSHRRALAEHGHLLPGLVSALDRVRPAGRDLLRRMPYGDDLDLDACIDAMIDLRAGRQPSDRLFTSVQEHKRDVAVVFALDLSSSTAERMPDSERGPRRILDLQRDAVLLLIEALERIGDEYGIYGFSGGGRDDVRLSVVKDLDERRSPAMMHRMEGLVPDHTTRMGPPIRHLTRWLQRSDAATRILLIVSDGRPYDLDYGQQYGDEAVLDYAIADTAAALAEARAAGVQPYLITVDPAGGDYLSRMCDPVEYHVISQARELPSALAQLYLVARAGQ